MKKEFKVNYYDLVAGNTVQITATLDYSVNNKENQTSNGLGGDPMEALFVAFQKAVNFGTWVLEDYSIGPTSIYVFVEDKADGKKIDINYEYKLGEDPLEMFIKSLFEKANEIFNQKDAIAS